MSWIISVCITSYYVIIIMVYIYVCRSSQNVSFKQRVNSVPNQLQPVVPGYGEEQDYLN